MQRAYGVQTPLEGKDEDTELRRMNGVRWRACQRDFEQTKGLGAKRAEPRDGDVITGAKNDQRKASGDVGRDSRSAREGEQTI